MELWPERIEAGEVLGDRYELVRVIGRGGMAEVWRGRDVVSGHAVAVKFLRPDTEDLQTLDTRELLSELDNLRGRFRREADLLGGLDHPGIPELYGQGLHHNVPYLAMRHVDGVTLHAFLADHSTLPMTVAAAVAAQVASALACAHVHPLVHRDLKPQNIMLSRQGIAVLIDFGIAKPLGTGVTRYTRRGSTLGSRGYQAPEQILEKEPTARTDIYALGCVAYELFTGRAPFLGDGARGLTDQHLHVEPAPPSWFVPAVPAVLDDLLLRMLAKDQQDRPYVEEVVDVLDTLVPRPGDPEPRPRLSPDPTRPFRVPGDAPLPTGRTPPAAPGAGPDLEEWLDARTVQGLCAEAEDELDTGEPGKAVRRLATLAERARREWGVRRPLVRRVWWLAADGLRWSGDCGAAAALYEGLVGELIPGQGDVAPGDVADRAVARLRLAECRLAFGEIGAALTALEESATTVRALPPDLAATVDAVRREVQIDVAERCADPEQG
ncbi:serine/threonine-protein kinase [Streptomyces sp. GSL17-111]|uniref:serine/threonine-protein kinase n=1 Tax=Streptomyces sp. GSL17-111 TaxID=3121596 RepID=UPI0030F41CDA